MANFLGLGVHMDLKTQIETIAEEQHVSYKEARHLLKSRVRKLYEAGEIDKATWKNIKNYIDKELK